MAAIRTVPCSSVTVVRLVQDRRALAAGVPDAAVDIGHLEGDVDDAVTVATVVIGERAGRVDRALDHEADGTTAQHVRVVVAVAGLGPGVGDQLHAVDGLVEVRGLGGVADRPHHGVPPGDRERVGDGVVLDQADQLPQLVDVEVGEPLLAGQGLVDAHRVRLLVLVFFRLGSVLPFR